MHRAKFTTRKRYQDTNKVCTTYQNIKKVCTTRKRYQDTNKVYNQEKVPRYQQVYNRKNVPRYQQSVHVVGILVCFLGSVNLAVNLRIVSSVQ